MILQSGILSEEACGQKLLFFFLQSYLITEPLCSETSLDIHGALVTWISSLFFVFSPRGKQVQADCNSESCSCFIKVLKKKHSLVYFTTMIEKKQRFGHLW